MEIDVTDVISCPVSVVIMMMFCIIFCEMTVYLCSCELCDRLRKSPLGNLEKKFRFLLRSAAPLLYLSIPLSLFLSPFTLQSLSNAALFDILLPLLLAFAHTSYRDIQHFNIC